MTHDTQPPQIPQREDECNIYLQLKGCALPVITNLQSADLLMVTHAFGHKIYSRVCECESVNTFVKTQTVIERLRKD